MRRIKVSEILRQGLFETMYLRWVSRDEAEVVLVSHRGRRTKFKARRDQSGKIIPVQDIEVEWE